MLARKLPWLALLLACAQDSPHPSRWSEARAAAWGREQPWRAGANYVPASADNALEMWQAATFDPARIDLELGWAEHAGMNTVRVFLHDLVWRDDAAGFARRIDAFLAIAARHRVDTVFVLFDSCWDPFPAPGPQPPPRPGVHNSRWVQSPGARALVDASEHPRLEAYVRGVVGAFASDPRVLAWDVWNEPDGTNDPSYVALEPKDKVDRVAALLPRVFAWARAASPTQPLTSAVWWGDWSRDDALAPVARIQLGESDVISLHHYADADDLERRIAWLERFGRPILLTEFVARPRASTWETALPVVQRHHVAAMQWGLVAGKTQTWFPWTSWTAPLPDREPDVWFHDLLRADGTPFDAREVELLQRARRPH